MTMPCELNGIFVVDKPADISSAGVVATVKRLTGAKKVGHAGTLDPMASGLLPLVLGRATRLVRFLPHSPKVYEGRIVLGVTTATEIGGQLGDINAALAAETALDQVRLSFDENHAHLDGLTRHGHVHRFLEVGGGDRGWRRRMGGGNETGEGWDEEEGFYLSTTMVESAERSEHRRREKLAPFSLVEPTTGESAFKL